MPCRVTLLEVGPYEVVNRQLREPPGWVSIQSPY